MNTALQDIRFAAAKGDDADSESEKKEREISTFETKGDLAMGHKSDGQDSRDG